MDNHLKKFKLMLLKKKYWVGAILMAGSEYIYIKSIFNSNLGQNTEPTLLSYANKAHTMFLFTLVKWYCNKFFFKPI